MTIIELFCVYIGVSLFSISIFPLFNFLITAVALVRIVNNFTPTKLIEFLDSYIKKDL